MTSTNPFKGRLITIVSPMRVIRHFSKDEHVVELRERKVTQWAAIEWLLFVDDVLIESRMYHGDGVQRYAHELSEVIENLRSAGWQENLDAIRPVNDA